MLLAEQETDVDGNVFAGFGSFLPPVEMFLVESGSFAVMGQPVFGQRSLTLQHEAVPFTLLYNSLLSSLSEWKKTKIGEERTSIGTITTKSSAIGEASDGAGNLMKYIFKSSHQYLLLVDYARTERPISISLLPWPVSAAITITVTITITKNDHQQQSQLQVTQI